MTSIIPPNPGQKIATEQNFMLQVFRTWTQFISDRVTRIVPEGGGTGQVLGKASPEDYDTEWVDQEGGGGGVVSPAQKSFIATEGQTSFTLDSSPEAAWVWIKGAAQDAATWAISGDDIVLTTPSDAGDPVEIYYLEVTLTSSFDQAEDSFIATGGQTSFTLSATPLAAWTWIKGAAQDPSTWEMLGNDILFSTPLDAGDAVEISYLVGI